MPVGCPLLTKSLLPSPTPTTLFMRSIPGSKGACDRLLSLPAFTSAKTVKINPDKPQQHARYLTLQQRKKLLVPTPRLRSGLFNHMQPPEGATTEDLKKCCTAQVKGKAKHNACAMY